METSPKLDKILQKIAKIEAIREGLFARQKPIQEKLMQSYKKLEKLENARDKLLLQQKPDDWNLLLSGNPSSELYRAARIAIDNLGLFMSGAWTETNRAAIKVMIRKNSPESLAQTEKAVELLLPYTHPHKDGYKYFGIFEHSLSAACIFLFLIKENEEYNIVTERGHRRETRASFKNLKEALIYIQKHHWYGDSEPEDSED